MVKQLIFILLFVSFAVAAQNAPYTYSKEDRQSLEQLDRSFQQTAKAHKRSKMASYIFLGLSVGALGITPALIGSGNEKVSLIVAAGAGGVVLITLPISFGLRK